jgi:alkanesulfonate monooxygenase SsuD/methylene tetrahydromethanopterin reductase-like flavin-dependent oxidoreductase (luciferase family)
MMIGKRFGFKTSQWGVSWPMLQETWQLGDSLHEFDSAWLFDHFGGVETLGQPQQSGDDCHEAWTIASALAAVTKRLQFGHLVLGNTHRHPALLARMATTLDHVAGPGRLILGLGAGWQADEHHAFGWEFPQTGKRLDNLEAAVRLIKGMWSSPNGFSFQQGPYSLVDAKCLPPPLTRGGPPIWLGTQGIRRGLRMVAQYADGWNATADFASFNEKRDALLSHCDSVKRNPDEIVISAQLVCGQLSAGEIVAAAREFLDAGVQELIFSMRAADGPAGLTRLARDVVAPLRDRYG